MLRKFYVQIICDHNSERMTKTGTELTKLSQHKVNSFSSDVCR